MTKARRMAALAPGAGSGEFVASAPDRCANRDDPSAWANERRGGRRGPQTVGDTAVPDGGSLGSGLVSPCRGPTPSSRREHDVFRNVVMRVCASIRPFVVAAVGVPSRPRPIVHHAVISIECRTRASRRRDGAEDNPGTTG